MGSPPATGAPQGGRKVEVIHYRAFRGLRETSAFSAKLIFQTGSCKKQLFYQLREEDDNGESEQPADKTVSEIMYER